MGLAGSLLVFTGLWHMVEWMMSGRNRDTAILIPFGIVYLVLGYMIVTFTGGAWVAYAGLIVTLIGVTGAFVTRKGSQVRGWVIWAFILIDIAIIAGLVSALLG